MDVVALTGFPSGATGFQGRRGPLLPPRHQPDRRTRMALLASRNPRTRLELLCSHGAGRPQPLVAGDAGARAVSPEGELPFAPRQPGSRRCLTFAYRRCVVALQSRKRLGKRFYPRVARPECDSANPGRAPEFL